MTLPENAPLTIAAAEMERLQTFYALTVKERDAAIEERDRLRDEVRKQLGLADALSARAEILDRSLVELDEPLRQLLKANGGEGLDSAPERINAAIRLIHALRARAGNAERDRDAAIKEVAKWSRAAGHEEARAERLASLLREAPDYIATDHDDQRWNNDNQKYLDRITSALAEGAQP